MCGAEVHLAQSMKRRFAGALKRKIGFVVEIEFAEKRRFGTARAFGDGGDAAGFLREPLDDHAGFGKRARAEDDAGGALVVHLFLMLRRLKPVCRWPSS